MGKNEYLGEKIFEFNWNIVVNIDMKGKYISSEYCSNCNL